MDLARAVAGDIVADLENFREVAAGTLRGIVLGVFDARRRRTEQKVLRERVGLDDGGGVGVRFCVHADQAEAVVEAHGVQGQADAAAERAAEGGADSLCFLRPDAAGKGHVLRFTVQLVLQADAAGSQADRKEVRILDSYFQ